MSEKAKEIKKALEDNKTDHLPYIDEWKCKFVEFADILTYINELESENELLRNAKVVYETVDYCYEDLKKAEKRIAELEKEIEGTPSYAKGYADGIKNTYEAMLPQKLENFAERLKEKLKEKVNADNVDVFVECAKLSDETLKEFIK